MNADRIEIAARRAQLLRARWWWQQNLGMAGALALVLALAAVVIAAAVRPTLSSMQRDLLRAHVARLDAAARSRGPVAETPLRDPRDAVRDAFPPVGHSGMAIATLLPLLEAGNVAADRAEYVYEEQEPSLVRLRVTVPIEGGYGPARRLIGTVLNAMPNAALDAIDLQRTAEHGERLNGQLRFSLFFRKEAP